MNTPSPLDSARALIDRGLSPIFVEYKSKKTIEKGWPKLRLRAEDLPQYFNGSPANVGILWGKASENQVDVDLDDPLALELADKFLPHTDVTFGRVSKPRSHRVFRLSEPARSRQWKKDDGSVIVELRSSGLQTIGPGSVHPSGESVRWDDEGEPALIDPDVLIAAIEALARAVKDACTHHKTDIKDPKTRRPKDPIDPIRKMSPDEVVRRALVTGPGQHDKKTMWLARGFKFNCGLDLRSARPHFDRWWAASARHCNESDPDAAWFKFERAWETAMIPLDCPGIAASVLARWDELPSVPEEARFGPDLRRLVRALAEMGRLCGDAPFAISAYMVADAFGVGITTAHEWLKGLVRRGVVVCDDLGKAGANGAGKARRLVWIGEKGMVDGL